MSASLSRPGGSPPPAIARLDDQTVVLEPIAQEACQAYQAEFTGVPGGDRAAEHAWCVHDTLYVLSWAIDEVRLPHGQFVRNVEWLANVLEARELPREQLARHLEIVADRVVERLGGPAANVAEVLAAGAAHVRADTVPVEHPVPEEHGENLTTAFVEALLRGELRGAEALIANARATLSPDSVYLQVLEPALVEIGSRWARAEVSVAQEHLATALIQVIAARLAPELPRRRQTGMRAIVACTDGEHHAVGARFVADFLDADGWETLTLGASTPTDGLVDMAVRIRPALVALSSTLTTHLNSAAAAVSALRSAVPGAVIALGGRAYAGDADLAMRLGADIFAGDAASFVAELRLRFGG